MTSRQPTLTAATTSSGAGLRNTTADQKRIQTGTSAVATTEPSDTMRVFQKSAIQTTSVESTASGEISRSAPTPAATPFPPLNFRNTGNMWPTMAALAAAPCQNM